jgi:hypothetical protein
VSIDDGTVDQDQTIFSFFGERIKDALPNATLTPPIVTIIDCCAWPITLGQITPRRARSQNIEDAVQYPAIILSCWTTPCFWKVRFNNRPFFIAQIKSTHNMLLVQSI